VRSQAITIGSLFSGIGGLELGIEAAFAEAGIPARLVWQVEQDAYCRAVLAQHWPSADRSVTAVRAAGLRVLPRVDVLCGGPPCQDISGAGRQEGLSGARSGLLFEYLRIVRELRPRVCVIENVYGGSWRTWLDAIRCGLEGAGYTV
jgi:DNA (cytosine-5)-methyltransferase 1